MKERRKKGRREAGRERGQEKGRKQTQGSSSLGVGEPRLTLGGWVPTVRLLV